MIGYCNLSFVPLSMNLKRGCPVSWPTLSLASGLRIICARCAMAPLSTTVWASSGVCLEMSLRVEAAMRLRAISGSMRHNTSRGTAPASTTDWDNAAQWGGERRETWKQTHKSKEWMRVLNGILKKIWPSQKSEHECLPYMRCVVRCSREPRRRPPSPRGQTPPGREPGRQLPRRPPRPGTARGSVWPPHAAQTLLPSCRTSARKHTQIHTHQLSQRIKATLDFYQHTGHLYCAMICWQISIIIFLKH